jgi:hypothetical protein
VPQNSLTHSKDEKIWQSMYDQELSKKMAGAGGIGLADMMMEQLGKHLEEAGAKTPLSTSLERAPIPIAPAPLFELAPRVPAAQPAASPDARAAGDIYGDPASAVAGGDNVPEPEAEAMPEFEALVDRIQAERQQPEVTVTRIITNATSIPDFNSIKPVRSGRGQGNPRVVRKVAPHNVPQGLAPEQAERAPEADAPRDPVNLPQAAVNPGDAPRAEQDAGALSESLFRAQSQPEMQPGVMRSIPPRPKPAPGPTSSPTAVSQARTSSLGVSTLNPVSRLRR